MSIGRGRARVALALIGFILVGFLLSQYYSQSSLQQDSPETGASQLSDKEGDSVRGPRVADDSSEVQRGALQFLQTISEKQRPKDRDEAPPPPHKCTANSFYRFSSILGVFSVTLLAED